VTVEGEEFVYFTTDTEVKRLRYRGGALTLDASWGPGRYALEGEDQSAGWDTCLGSGSIWMMDMGRPPNWGMNRALGCVCAPALVCTGVCTGVCVFFELITCGLELRADLERVGMPRRVYACVHARAEPWPSGSKNWARWVCRAPRFWATARSGPPW
jgi:hypothetical protein